MFNANLVQDANCLCGFINEDAKHYLLYCNNFSSQRLLMINEINVFAVNITIELLLSGDESLSSEENDIVFLSVQKYIKSTKRFAHI